MTNTLTLSEKLTKRFFIVVTDPAGFPRWNGESDDLKEAIAEGARQAKVWSGFYQVSDTTQMNGGYWKTVSSGKSC